MKQTINIIVLFLMAGLFACQKERTLCHEDPFTKLSFATQMAVKTGSVQEIRQKYVLLSIDEKQKLWEKKLEGILKNDAGKLSSGQKKVILMVKNFLITTPLKTLITDPSKGKKFVEDNLSFFEMHFSSKQLFLLIETSFFCENFSILNDNEYLPQGSVQKQNATCSCYWSLSCMYANVPCMDGECNVTFDGCGIFGTAQCVGTCR